MGLSSALQWWEEWQLRILVLSSLVVHWLLFFAIWVRTVHTFRRLRPLIWIAYIGGDALAIYALATLFNRHKQEAPDGQSTSLEIVWAPVLLIHLGGQSTISAYGLEDNELWKRHLLTLVSQIAVALYVFGRWWSGGERMMQVAVLLFLLGIAKFSQKPWGLRRASFNSMLASTNVSPRKQMKFGAGCWKLCTSSCTDMFVNMMQGEEGQLELSLEEYIQQANKGTQDTEVAGDQENELDESAGMASALANIYKMFVDMPYQYWERLTYLRCFLKFDDERRHQVSGYLLYIVFLTLYTRTNSSFSILGCGLFSLLPILAIVSLVFFVISGKDGYSKSDVTVTYILFACTAAQELLSCFIQCLLEKVTSKLTHCHDMVSQYGLISLCVRKKNPTILMKLAAFDSLRGYINKQWYIWQVPAALQITGLVFRHAKDGWKTYIHDVPRYKRFNNLRGQRALKRHRQLVWSLKRPFDQSVLLWHIATDICFHYQSTITSPRRECVDGSRVISNYMIYLLSIHPEMLMPGTTQGIVDLASYELDLILIDSKMSLNNEEVLAREIMSIVKSSDTGTPIPTQEVAQTTEEVEQPAADGKYIISHVPAACRLAEELMELGEETRWTVIQGVWVEMLCYSASRCRGYLHAKSLGEGREYLTTVWLLWSYLGMETFAYMIQSAELQEEEEDEEEEKGEEEKEKEKEEASTSQFRGYADLSVEMYPV